MLDLAKLNPIDDQELGLLVLRSQNIARKTGDWTYQDHIKLEKALSELENLRNAVARYSRRVQEYQDAVIEVVEFLEKHNEWCNYRRSK